MAGYAIGGRVLAVALLAQAPLAARADTSFETQAKEVRDAVSPGLRAVGEGVEKSNREALAEAPPGSVSAQAGALATAGLGWLFGSRPSLLYDFDDGEGPVPAHAHLRGGGLVADSAEVSLTAHIGLNATVSGRARVAGYAVIEGQARVRGHARVTGPDVHIDGSAVVEDDAEISASARIGGRARVRGKARVLSRDPAWPAGRHGTPTVDGAAEVSDSAVVCGNAHVTGEAVVSGTARVGGHARVTGRLERGAVLEGEGL